jgi:hypothetical protein
LTGGKVEVCLWPASCTAAKLEELKTLIGTLAANTKSKALLEKDKYLTLTKSRLDPGPSKTNPRSEEIVWILGDVYIDRLINAIKEAIK